MKAALFWASVAFHVAACAVAERTTNMGTQAEHVVGGKAADEVFSDRRVAQLASAACRGDLEGVSAALASGADVNATGYKGVTPLIWVQHCENIAGMRALLDAGADPNVRFGIFTPVIIAAGMTDPANLELLLAHGGDASAYIVQTNALKSDSALKVAFRRGLDGLGWENYYALLNAGADINWVGDGSTVAEFGANMDRFDKVFELLERGYDQRLDHLALLAVGADRTVMTTDQPQWADKVVALLQERGAQFPLPPPGERSH